MPAFPNEYKSHDWHLRGAVLESSAVTPCGKGIICIDITGCPLQQQGKKKKTGKQLSMPNTFQTFFCALTRQGYMVYRFEEKDVLG